MATAFSGISCLKSLQFASELSRQRPSHDAKTCRSTNHQKNHKCVTSCRFSQKAAISSTFLSSQPCQFRPPPLRKQRIASVRRQAETLALHKEQQLTLDSVADFDFDPVIDFNSNNGPSKSFSTKVDQTSAEADPEKNLTAVYSNRRGLTLVGLCVGALLLPSVATPSAHAAQEASSKGAPGGAPREAVKFRTLEGGVQVLDIREGGGDIPKDGDRVAVHYYARLAAKQGWRFDATYDHKDADGAPQPFEFVIGSKEVIAGLDTAVRSMRVGGTRRAVIPPSQGYQTTSDEPVPPNYFDRQRLFTTIFNPTRISNGEGSTLGTVIFDIQLLGIRQLSS
eukprot:jgi/Mesen1/8473/ME000478S07961